MQAAGRRACRGLPGGCEAYDACARGDAAPRFELLLRYMFRITRLVVLAESTLEFAIAASMPSLALSSCVMLAASSLSVPTLTSSSLAPSAFPPLLMSLERGPPDVRSDVSSASSVCCCCCPVPSATAWRLRAACSPAFILWLVDANSRKMTARNLARHAGGINGGESRRRRN